MACAWAVMQHLGLEGYLGLTRTTIDATRRMIAGVRAIGQAFTDEIFRVFAAQHPSVKITPAHADQQALFMIRRAQAAHRERQ